VTAVAPPAAPRLAGIPSLALLGFAVAMAMALLGPLATSDLVYNRTRFTIWATVVLAIPAVVLFILAIGRAPPGATWRAWWTAAFGGYLVHLWYGFGVMFAGDLAATFDAQGTLVAGSNFVLALVWLASVACAWSARPAAWLHALATLLFLVSAITSTLVFGRPPSPWFGWALAVGIAGAAIGRLWSRFAGSSLNPR
jgi:hypothetical protein